MKSVVLAGALMLAAVSMAGCGKQGDLERPGPLWGHPEKRETERAPRGSHAERLPDPATIGSQPARNVPIEGQNDPRGPTPR